MTETSDLIGNCDSRNFVYDTAERAYNFLSFYHIARPFSARIFGQLGVRISLKRRGHAGFLQGTYVPRSPGEREALASRKG